jgi:hypothetical protein
MQEKSKLLQAPCIAGSLPALFSANNLIVELLGTLYRVRGYVWLLLFIYANKEIYL